MVFALDSDKTPLDMCHPARARKLLWDGKAAVYRKAPLTIILKRKVEDPPKQDYRLKIAMAAGIQALRFLRARMFAGLDN